MDVYDDIFNLDNDFLRNKFVKELYNTILLVKIIPLRTDACFTKIT